MEILLASSFSIAIIDNEESLSCAIEFLSHVLIRLRVEKALSAATLVAGIA